MSSSDNVINQETSIQEETRNDFKCTVCKTRSFTTYRALKQRLRQCLKKNPAPTQAVPSSQPIVRIEPTQAVPSSQPIVRNEPTQASVPSSQPIVRNEPRQVEDEAVQQNENLAEVTCNFKWDKVSETVITNRINTAYEKIVYWRKNIFMLPTGAAGKAYIQELTRLINAWTYNSPVGIIAIKAVHLMPSLLLQKPSKRSKSKDHVKALERRLDLWKKGEIESLVFEAETIQKRLPNNNRKKNNIPDLQTIRAPYGQR